MAKFLVKSHITFGSKTTRNADDELVRNKKWTWEPGEIVDLNDKQAAELAHAIEPATQPIKDEGKAGKEKD